MYHLLHAGMAREPPLPLRHGSWPLQRHTSILHITNVSFASASVCPSCVIALKCVSHTLASCVTGEVVLWFGTWNCMPPPLPSTTTTTSSHLPLFSFQHLGSPLKWHCFSTVVGQPPCHCCVCHFLRFFLLLMHSLFIWTFHFLCLSVWYSIVFSLSTYLLSLSICIHLSLQVFLSSSGSPQRGD